jgi:magnesium-transporting ATPase (P-type)
MAVEFMKVLSTTHSCVADRKNDGYSYSGPSPDEVCLVEFAREHGFEFCFGSDELIVVN